MKVSMYQRLCREFVRWLDVISANRSPELIPVKVRHDQVRSQPMSSRQSRRRYWQ